MPLSTSDRRDLLTIQEAICDLLLSVDIYQDWRPTENDWSFRQIGVHMAKVEKECHIYRINALLRSNNPTFTYYWNTVDELGDDDIYASVRLWKEYRRQFIERLDQLSRTEEERQGQHDVFGTITPAQLPRLVLDHDGQHHNHLKKMITQFNESD
ncbi:MAG: DinB family protein [Chloroflexota bacterium]